MISRSRRFRWLFPLLLLAPLAGCESRSRDTPSDNPQRDRDTVHTRTQTSPRLGGQGGADSSSPTPAEGGAVSGGGSPGGDGSATTPAPGSQRYNSADLGREVQRDKPQGAMGSPPNEQKGSSATHPQAGTGPTGSNTQTGSHGATGTHTGSKGTTKTEPETHKGNPPATGAR